MEVLAVTKKITGILDEIDKMKSGGGCSAYEKEILEIFSVGLHMNLPKKAVKNMKSVPRSPFSSVSPVSVSIARNVSLPVAGLGNAPNPWALWWPAACEHNESQLYNYHPHNKFYMAVAIQQHPM